MSKFIQLSMIFVIFLITILNASADVSFSNDIEISDESINLTITENYTGDDAEQFKNDFDINENGIVESSEISVFKSNFIANRADQFLEYVILDGEYSLLKIDSISMEFDGAAGNINDNELIIITAVSYGFNQSFSDVPQFYGNFSKLLLVNVENDMLSQSLYPSRLSSGDHNIWIIGHPSIRNIEISISDDIELVTYAGLENVTQRVGNGLNVLEGSSGIRSFMIDDRQILEYAVFLEISKESFYDKKLYENESFLPMLVILELLLALSVFYIIIKNKIK